MGKILRRHDPFQSFQRLLIDAGVHQRGGEVPRIRNTARIQPGFDRFLAVALFEGSEFRLRCGAMPGLLGSRHQLTPLIDSERFAERACVLLNLYYALAQIGGGAARGRRGIVEFVGQPGRHRTKLHELLAFLRKAFQIPQPRGERSHDIPGHRRRAP